MNVEEMRKVEFTTDDVDKLRKSIKIGDILRYPMMFKDLRGKNMLVERFEPVQVIGRHPHLVEAVAGDGRHCTITYVEMLLEPQITQRMKKDRKRGR